MFELESPHTWVIIIPWHLLSVPDTEYQFLLRLVNFMVKILESWFFEHATFSSPLGHSTELLIFTNLYFAYNECPLVRTSLYKLIG